MSTISCLYIFHIILLKNNMKKIYISPMLDWYKCPTRTSEPTISNKNSDTLGGFCQRKNQISVDNHSLST